MPTLLLVPGEVAMRLLDPVRHRGMVSRERAIWLRAAKRLTRFCNGPSRLPADDAGALGKALKAPIIEG